jgi:glycosyltransferase involved in cell wall biosynthesis
VNIGIVTPHFYPTAQEIRVTKLAEALVQGGSAVTVLCAGRAGQRSPNAPRGVEIVPLRPWSESLLARSVFARFPINPVWINWLKREFGRRLLDAVIVRDLRLAIPTYIAARANGIPVILDIGEHYPGMMEILGKQRLIHHIIRSGVLIRLLESISVRLADWVWVVADENRWRLTRYNPNVEVISNFPSLLKVEGEPAPQRPYTPDGDPVRFMFLGLLDNLRGLDLAVDAFALVAKDLPNTRLDLYGDGFFRASLEAQVKRLGLQDKVTFPGWVGEDAKYSTLRKGDVGLLLHRVCDLCEHTIPNKLFDYMAVGLPVLSTKLGPISSILSREDCGEAVDENPAAVAEAMKRMVLDQAGRRAMGARGVAAVQLRYSWQDEAVRAVQRITDLVQTNNRERPRRRRLMLDPQTVTTLGALTTLGGL